MSRLGPLLALAGLAFALLLVAQQDMAEIGALLGEAGFGLVLAALAHIPSMALNAHAWRLLLPRRSRPGLAAMTAMMTIQQAQASADRSGMVDSSAMGGMSGTGTGAAAEGAMMQQYQMYSQLQSQVFTTAMNDLLYVTAILTALGVPLALMLKHGKPAKSDAPMAH